MRIYAANNESNYRLSLCERLLSDERPSERVLLSLVSVLVLVVRIEIKVC